MSTLTPDRTSEVNIAREIRVRGAPAHVQTAPAPVVARVRVPVSGGRTLEVLVTEEKPSEAPRDEDLGFAAGFEVALLDRTPVFSACIGRGDGSFGDPVDGLVGLDLGRHPSLRGCVDAAVSAFERWRVPPGHPLFPGLEHRPLATWTQVQALTAAGVHRVDAILMTQAEAAARLMAPLEAARKGQAVHVKSTLETLPLAEREPDPVVLAYQRAPETARKGHRPILKGLAEMRRVGLAVDWTLDAEPLAEVLRGMGFKLHQEPGWRREDEVKPRGNSLSLCA